MYLAYTERALIDDLDRIVNELMLPMCEQNASHLRNISKNPSALNQEEVAMFTASTCHPELLSRQSTNPPRTSVQRSSAWMRVDVRKAETSPLSPSDHHAASLCSSSSAWSFQPCRDLGASKMIWICGGARFDGFSRSWQQRSVGRTFL